MRGEHGACLTHSALTRGSSPHARGTPPPSAAYHQHPGIIPACAGNTCRFLCRATVPRDHPRMRGEHCALWHFIAYPTGSSPHARGTHNTCLRNGVNQGIIPACAGNTCRLSGVSYRTGDHPRMRGEHCWHCVLLPHDWGSSPHARGTHAFEDSNLVAGGIIPACAGNTCSCFILRPPTGDHPRMRGEHPSIGGLSTMR